MATQPKKSRRKGRFSRFLFFWTAALAVLVAVLLVQLWAALARYESTTPEAAVMQFLKTVQSADEQQLLEQSGFALSPYEKPGAYRDAVSASLEGIPADREQLRFAKQQKDGACTVKVIAPDASVTLELIEKETGGWTVRPPVPETQSCTILAPSHAAVTVNGQPLPADQSTGSRTATGYEDLADAPQVLEYKLDGLLAAPEVAAVLEDGTACAVQAGKDGAVEITAPVPAAQQQELTDFAWNAAHAYVRYVSRDAAFGEVDVYLHPDTPLRETVRTFDTYWYTDHNSATFANEELLATGSVSDTCCWVELKLEYLVDIGYREVTIPVHYRLYAAKLDGAWKLVSMESL